MTEPVSGYPELRIHFTAEDLARTWVAPRPDPLWETLLSVQWLQLGRRRPPTRLGGPVPADITVWRQEASAALAGRELSQRVRDRLVPLMPNAAYFPDFLTPGDGLLGLRPGIETVLSTPRARVRSELALMTTRPTATNWATDLADGRAAALDALGATMRDYFTNTLAPYWPHIHTAINAERATRAGVDARDVEAILAGLRPLAHWDAADRVLSCSYPIGRDITLAGRGLVLIPSWFCFAMPVSLIDPDQQPVLVYPVTHQPPPDTDVAALAALIGPTRAKILAAITLAATTDTILRRVRISRAMLSRHAAVLRDNNLITETRHGASVFYTRTPLGEALVARGHA